jgi:hypothetical protein
MKCRLTRKAKRIGSNTVRLGQALDGKWRFLALRYTSPMIAIHRTKPEKRGLKRSRAKQLYAHGRKPGVKPTSDQARLRELQKTWLTRPLRSTQEKIDARF